MPEQLDLEIAPTFAPLTIRIRDGWKRVGERRTTREKGRRYRANLVCPKCYGRFTSKGFWRHARKCSHKPPQK